jgi:RimJ/RimL family protein N-acetyltransferase
MHYRSGRLCTTARFHFSPAMPTAIAEFSTWFADPELARRLEAPTEAWMAHVSASSRLAAWTVSSGAELVGYVQVEFYDDRRCSIAMAMKPSRRRQGLSTAMLTGFLETVIPDQQIVEAEIEQDNIAAIRAAEKAGFVRISAKPDADGFIAFEFRG